jgi:hypothetical protein
MKLPVVLLLFVFSLDCSAQSIADAARTERERQKAMHSVITVTGVAATVASGTAATQTAPGAAPAASIGTAPGPTDNKGRDEKYWRSAFQKARDDIKHSDEKIQLLDLKIKDLNTQLLRQSDLYNRENRLGPQITETQKQLDDARKEAEQARQNVTDLEDDLRKSGGLPGWSR